MSQSIPLDIQFVRGQFPAFHHVSTRTNSIFCCKRWGFKEIASTLVPHKVAVRSVGFYAWRCIEALGIDPNDGVVRASMLHYNTMEEVERLISSLEEIL